MGNGRGKEKGGRGKGEGKEREKKGSEKGKEGRKREGDNGKGKGKNFVQLLFFPRKNPALLASAGCM